MGRKKKKRRRVMNTSKNKYGGCTSEVSSFVDCLCAKDFPSRGSTFLEERSFFCTPTVSPNEKSSVVH